MTLTAPTTMVTAGTRSVAVPNRLGALHGPRTGRLRLPASVYWGPEPEVDLRYWDDVAKAYEATLREGDLEDVCTLLHADLLLEVWPEIVLPRAVRDAWERRFSEFAR